MPEPDPRHTRLAELRQQQEALGLRVNAAPVGSLEWAAWLSSCGSDGK